jgi:hypothetical protein
MVGFNNQQQSNVGQVFYDSKTGQYYTFQADGRTNPFNPSSTRVNLSGLNGQSATPANQRPANLTPRAGVGPSLESIYGGTAGQMNPFPATPAPPRPSFLPQFDVNAVLARAQNSGPMRQGFQPSFMARPQPMQMPQQATQPAAPAGGIASLPTTGPTR